MATARLSIEIRYFPLRFKWATFYHSPTASWNECFDPKATPMWQTVARFRPSKAGMVLIKHPVSIIWKWMSLEIYFWYFAIQLQKKMKKKNVERYSSFYVRLFIIRNYSNGEFLGLFFCFNLYRISFIRTFACEHRDATILRLEAKWSDE